MKRKHVKTILIVLGICLIVREFLPIDLSLYESNGQWETTGNNTSKINAHDKLSYSNHPCFDLATLEEINLLVSGFDTEPIEVETIETPIIVETAHVTSIGITRFLPLFKPIKFTSNNTYSWHANACYRGIPYSIIGSGSLEITGTNRIFGICSGKRAKKIIEQIALKEIQKTVFKEVSDKFDSIVDN